MNARCAPRRWIIDPDAPWCGPGWSPLRARHGLCNSNADIAYCRGPAAPAVRGFEVMNSWRSRRGSGRPWPWTAGAGDPGPRCSVDPDALGGGCGCARPALSAVITAWVPGLPVTAAVFVAGPRQCQYADGGYFQGAPLVACEDNSTMRLLLAACRCAVLLRGGAAAPARVPAWAAPSNGQMVPRARLEPHYMSTWVSRDYPMNRR